jgi:ElaA protein
MTEQTEWEWLHFSALSAEQLYAVLALRMDVFILEQQCLWNDLDGLDQDAHHLLGWRTVDGKRQLAAYLRLLAPGVHYDEMSIGRVVNARFARGSGIGRELLNYGIKLAEQQYPGQRIKIGAQRYLEKFYASFGFLTVSEPYDEDGIMHVKMLR